MIGKIQKPITTVQRTVYYRLCVWRFNNSYMELFNVD